jgi:hypothetical protein
MFAVPGSRFSQFVFKFGSSFVVRGSSFVVRLTFVIPPAPSLPVCSNDERPHKHFVTFEPETAQRER